MLHLLLEILNHSQLERARPGIVSELTDSLERIFVETGLIPEYRENGMVLLSSGSAFISGPHVLVASAYTIAETVDGFSEDLSGFNILIDDAPSGQPAEVLSAMKKRLLIADPENCIWIGENLLPALAPYIEYVKHSILYRVSGLKKTETARPSGIESFCSRPEAEGAIWREIGKVQSGEADFLIVAGDPLNLPYATVLRSLENRGLGPHDRLILHGDCGGNDPFASILSCLTAKSTEDAVNSLSAEERSAWSIAAVERPSVDGGDDVQDTLSEDHRIRFELLLSGFARRNAERDLPAVVIRSVFGKKPDSAIDPVLERLKEFIVRRKIVFILIREGTALPPILRDLKFSEYEIPILSPDEVASSLPIFPGQDGNRDRIDRVLLTAKGLPLPVFHTGKLYEKKIVRKAGDQHLLRPEDIAWQYLEQLPEDVFELLYVLRLSGGVLSPQQVEGYFQKSARTEPLPVTVQDLYSIGFIHDPVTMSEIYPALYNRIAEWLRAKEGEIRSGISAYAFSLWETNRLKSTVRLIDLLLNCGSWDRAFRVFDRMLRNLFARNLPLHPEEHAVLIRAFRHKAETPQNEKLETLLFAAGLREAVRTGKEPPPSMLAERLKHAEEKKTTGGELVEIARYYNARGEYRTAMKYAKQALIFFQDTTDAEGEAESGLELGHAMLAEERLPEAREYFSIVRHSLEKTGFIYLLIRSITFEAVCDFIHGNYTRSLQNAITAYASAEKHGIRRYQMYLLLVTGRIFFDLGQYDEAIARFGKGKTIAETYRAEAPATVFCNWTARSYLYFNRPDDCLNLLNLLPRTRETLYFTAEALLETGKTEDAASIAEEALSKPIERDKRLHGDIPDWESGYALIENLIFRKDGKNDILTRLIRALKAYVQGKTGIMYNEALAELYSLTRSEKLSEYDPYNFLYYYYYAEILPKERDRSIDDRLTVLSKAVKYLQERMSRIEDTGDKGFYLTKNVWNDRLFKESRKNNLV